MSAYVRCNYEGFSGLMKCVLPLGHSGQHSTLNEHPTPSEQPEDLRAALIEKYMEIAGAFYYEGSDEKTEREEYAPRFADEILRLCEAAALAALPDKVHTTSVKELQALSPSGDANEGVGFERGRNSTIATAQANIHKRFGGTGK